MLVIVIAYGIFSLKNLFIDKLMRVIFTISLMAVVQDLDKIIKIKLSVGIKTATLILVFLTQFLGEILDLYRIINCWDKIIHFLAGVLFYWYFIEMYIKHIKEKKIYFLGAVYSLGICAIWEFLEFASDKILFTNMQSGKLIYQNGLEDTMYDLLLGAAGATIFCMVHMLILKFGCICSKVKKIIHI